MKIIHTPLIGARYWGAITVASIFGTNLGDLYAHGSGLGIVGGLPLLALLFAVVYWGEKFDTLRHQSYYWIAIIIIRTGATNIGDILAGRNNLHIDRLILTGLLALALATLAWRSRSGEGAGEATGQDRPPVTNLLYWLTMLVAGAFGTVFGDFCSHAIGGGAACVMLAAVLAIVLYAGRKGLLTTLGYYWFSLALVRTFGTAAGDWLAENPQMHWGLLQSTLVTGAVFVLTLMVWREPRRV